MYHVLVFRLTSAAALALTIKLADVAVNRACEQAGQNPLRADWSSGSLERATTVFEVAEQEQSLNSEI